MKSLYVADLDGTLFNSKKQVTDYTAHVLNTCIDKGMLFSVATARMPYGCDYRLSKINLNTPSILTNGVFLYDFNKKEYLLTETIENSTANQIVEAFKRHQQTPFLYTFSDNSINIYYGNEKMLSQTQYYSDRAKEACGEIALVSDYEKQLAKSEAVYFALTGEKEQLEPIADDISKIENAGCAYYLNIYNGLYCLEVFSGNASKKNALRKFMELYNIDELTVFGDNLNDLSMFEIADFSYATGNALPEVKAVATAVLDDCDHDGVAKFLSEKWGIK